MKVCATIGNAGTLTPAPNGLLRSADDRLLLWARRLSGPQRKAIRKKAKYNRNQLAERVGCAPSMITHWEWERRSLVGTLGVCYARELWRIDGGQTEGNLW